MVVRAVALQCTSFTYTSSLRGVIFAFVMNAVFQELFLCMSLIFTLFYIFLNIDELFEYINFQVQFLS